MGERSRKPILIAIAGGSGSGKSWLGSRLADRLPGRVEVVCMDSFYRDLAHLPVARRAQLNFDHPRAIETELLETAVAAASKGEPFDVPQYDYVTHTRTGASQTCRPGRFVIFEGLWMLRTRRLRSFFDLRIFVEASAKWRMERRLERDVGERRRTRESVIRQFRDHVEPMHELYVEPQVHVADEVVVAPVKKTEVQRLLSRIGS